MSWDKKLFPLPDGRIVEARMPVIVSASRRTDIPAFYADWFFDRLEKGYSLWTNPFNKQDSYVSYRNTSFIVFWSKNPRPLTGKLPVLASKRIGCYVQYTLNDYEREGLEPNVPPLAERIETFRLLSDCLGKEAVIWRFDPLLLAPGLSPRQLLARIWRLGNRLQGSTDKLVFSFVDVLAYRKVQQNLLRETDGLFTKDTLPLAEPSAAQRQELVEGLVKLRKAWSAEGWSLSLATCAEQADLEQYGIAHNRCIDGDLIARLWPDDRPLLYYLRTGSLPQSDLFGGIPPLPPVARNLKDKGQRQACGCILSKDIGMYNTCPHLCVYCYANSSRTVVCANHRRHDPTAPSLVPGKDFNIDIK